jgi:hypothetical protein
VKMDQKKDVKKVELKERRLVVHLAGLSDS